VQKLADAEGAITFLSTSNMTASAMQSCHALFFCTVAMTSAQLL
jgi:hypothetical protein